MIHSITSSQHILFAIFTGCHLLCHDDVIGTRRVSYIIYLTDPDEVWTEEDGGALELYPLDRSPDATIVNNGEEMGGEQGVPVPCPTAKILPQFNTMAMFAVQPGRSYHSVQVGTNTPHRCSLPSTLAIIPTNASLCAMYPLYL